MVDFAGWLLPVQYRAGIIAEHRHCRARAALFDVSHMGQATLSHPDGAAAAAVALERLTPGGLATLAPGGARYTQFTNAAGGVLDDLIVSHAGDSLFLVVNASRADHDFAHMRRELPDCALTTLDRALIALQGPEAETALAALIPEAAELTFMRTRVARWNGAEIRVSRLGYTGEDGFEISLPNDVAAAFADALLRDDRVEVAGLGARDSLRLEAGLPLYGHELTEEISPAEAGLGFSIPKRRREQGGFPGADEIIRQLRDGPARRLVGIRPEGRAPAREGVEILSDGRPIGRVASGGFGPTVDGPIALGLVEADHAEPGAALELMVRGVARPARVVALPFVPHRYKRG